MAQKKLAFDFIAKTKGPTNELFIEGWANRAMKDGVKIIDRGKEYIPADQWSIQQWLQNPVIFFNHDRSIPIGKGVDAKVTPEGLWIKAQISQSDSPDIKKARDLIQEGILRTFSVGIDVAEEEYMDTGETILKGVNLLETSVVSIPMNQESFFSISKKSLSETPLDILEYEIMKAKGKEFSALIHQKLHVLAQCEKFNREKTIEQIVKESTLAKEYITEVFAGAVKSVPENLVKVISKILAIDEKELAAVAFVVPDPDSTKEVVAQGPLGTTDTLDANSGQPNTIALQQLTVLLGQLIAETQKTSKLMTDHFAAMAAMPPKPGDPAAPKPTDPAPEHTCPAGKDCPYVGMALPPKKPEADPAKPSDAPMDPSTPLPDGPPKPEDPNDPKKPPFGKEDEEAKFLDTIQGYKEKLETSLSRFSV